MGSTPTPRREDVSTCRKRSPVPTCVRRVQAGCRRKENRLRTREPSFHESTGRSYSVPRHSLSGKDHPPVPTGPSVPRVPTVNDRQTSPPLRGRLVPSPPTASLLSDVPSSYPVVLRSSSWTASSLPLLSPDLAHHCLTLFTVIFHVNPEPNGVEGLPDTSPCHSGTPVGVPVESIVKCLHGDDTNPHFGQ